MGRHAARTDVSAGRSREQIEREVSRYGADSFSYGWDDSGTQTSAIIGFRVDGLWVRFEITMPARESFRYTEARGSERSDDQVEKLFEQAQRQKWRALLLVVKAKLEAVESGITTVEEEFLAHFVTPDGQTFGAHAIPQIRAAYESGKMPRSLLPAPGETP